MKYSKDHEWVRIDGDTAVVGISNYAQEQLGDVVFVELPKVGTAVEQAGQFAVVESVKAASEVYAPIGGEVIAVNAALNDQPQLVNQSAEQDGWFVKLKVKDARQADALMDAAAYQAFLKTLG
ncbi:MAG: glycine cleavage system protein GcvH [Alphaproteobacteria bacterium]